MSTGSFEGIHNLLSRYRKYISDRDGNRQKIEELITRVSGVHLSPHEFTIRKGELYITGNSILKNEIFLHRERILNELHKEGITNITEIH